MQPTHLHLVLGNPASFAETDHQRSGDGATPETALLASPVDDGLEPDTRPPADVSRAYSLGTVDLVARNAEDVNVHVVDVNRDLADSLGSVRVEVDTAMLADDLTDLLEWLDNANLVVDGHDGNEARLGRDCRLELGEIDKTI